MTRPVTRRAFLHRAGLLGLGSSALVLVRSWRQTSPWPPFRRRFSALGTRIQLTVFETPTQVARVACEAALEEMVTIHRLMSTHERESQLSRVNRQAGRASLEVDGRLVEVIRESLKWSRLSRGVFDPTVLPLLRAWGFRDYRFDRVPEDSRLQAALDRVGYRHIWLDGCSLGLKVEGGELDVGGVAKGYALDRAVRILQRYGISQALLEAGGDLYALGHPPHQKAWSIGIRHPHKEAVCALLQVTNQAVATSGSYFAYRQYRGKRYGHLIDPRNGEPIDAYLSTTVVAPSALQADALSTALFVAGRGTDPPPLPDSSAWFHIGATSRGALAFEASANFPNWQPVRL